ncbi:MAG: response regulator [Gemmatimonadetes bacterium]|nr:response regulator [Gemmatimonadota bacterium]
MKLPLRIRFSIYALAGAGYLAGLIVTAAFVGLPALLRVDRSLAPLQSVFQAISARQRRVLDAVGSVEEILSTSGGSSARARPMLPLGERPASSLLSVYGQLLAPAAAKKLAIAEDELGAIESALGDVVARYELGDRKGAQAKLAEIRRAEDRSQHLYTEAMVLALNTGVAARRAFRQSMDTLAWSAAVWIVIGVLLIAAIGYDVNRHVWVPIRTLETRVRRTAAGEWTGPLHFPPGDELSALAAQFDALTEALRQRAGQHAHLATAGELLSGTAHELNNPLQAIRSMAELRVAADPESRDWTTVLAQVERASKLTRDLVQFVRPAAREVRRTSLNDVVKSAVELIEFQYRADGIGLELDLESVLPDVRVDAHEMAQVVVNLLGNAHAVLARTEGPKRVFVRTWTEGGLVHCRVRDTGPGISTEIRGRIFSPFFTTRQTGVGLGLTVSRNLVRGAGGDLVLDPADARGGASFTFSLPAAQAVAAVFNPVMNGQRVEASVDQSSPFHGMTILVVDDEDAIRGVLERYFRRDGATVVVAEGGNRAVEAIRREAIDVVLLDLRMPDLDGTEVYRIMRRERPELASRTIFLSGDATRVTEELDVPRNRVLVKPVELGELRRVVSDLAAGVRGQGPGTRDP